MKENKKIELRNTRKEEVIQAVPLIYSSGPDAFEYVFKNSKINAKDFLKYAFTREGGEFSYKNHYSLYYNSQMAGIGSVFNAKEAASFAFYDALKIIRFYNIASPVVLKRGLQVESIIKLPQKQEIALAHLAIEPSLRGRGLGTELIHLLKSKVNKTDENYFILDVSEENPKAKSLYERLGFVTTVKNDSKLKNKFSYVPNHFRMELAQNKA